MDSATFLLVINFAIGLCFATAFLALTRGSRLRLGRWCAAGFLSAAATVTVEAFAFLIPIDRLTSALSFGLLMAALTLIAFGLARHYRPDLPVRALATGLFGLLAVASAFNAGVVFDLPRGSWGQALGYQLPFAVMAAIAAGIVLAFSPRRAVDLALGAVLAASALHFAAKAVLIGLAGRHGPGVRDYLYDTYAFYSQTAGGVLSLMLGVALLGLTSVEVMAEAARRLQRDGLSGVLNRAAFMERVALALRRRPAGEPVCVVLCDLDRFKAVNDRFGHAAGDAVIAGFGAVLRARLGEGVPCGRLGGEEFCFLLTACDGAGAGAVVEAIRMQARAARYALVPAEVAVTASFGIAVIARDEPFDAALRRADLALYAVKAAGRDGCRLAEAGGTDPAAQATLPPETGPFRIRATAGRAGG